MKVVCCVSICLKGELIDATGLFADSQHRRAERARHSGFFFDRLLFSKTETNAGRFMPVCTTGLFKWTNLIRFLSR